MNIYIPFTYIIGWSQHKKFYYGCKFAKGCKPADLWSTYFTSSKYVKEFREQFGEPDIIKIHRTFSNKNACVLFENDFLIKIDAKNNPLFLNESNGYRNFNGNSKKCIQKRVRTNLKKYGNGCAINCEGLQLKSKLTKLEKYDNENYNNREKAKSTCLEKYGVDNPNKSKKIREKTTNTLLDQYGVTNVSQIEEIKQKKRIKSLEIYGTENVLQSDKIKNQIKQTNLGKYGVENAGNIQVTCPWCNKTGSISGMTTNHFDNCPKNPNAVVLHCACGFKTTSKGGFSTHSKWCKIKD